MKKRRLAVFHYRNAVLLSLGCVTYLVFAALFGLGLGSALLIIALLAWAILWRLFANWRDKKRGWGIIGGGRDILVYREWQNGRWERIEISAELLTGPKSRAIYLPKEGEWHQKYPTWAANRRLEIISRIKSQYPPEFYSYHPE